jgi:LCP family protein required for cell wall assembly
MDSLHPKRKCTPHPKNTVAAPPTHSLDLGSEPAFLSQTQESLSVQRKPRTSPPHHQKRNKILLSIGLIFGILLLLCALFLFAKVAHISKTLSFESQTNSSFFLEITDAARTLFSQRVPLKQTDENRINILLLGRAGEHYPGKNLTDTIMLASINTKTHQVALLSFPRDLYTPIGQGDSYTKINAIYQIGLNTQEGVSLLRDTIEQISGEPVHYSLIVDFDGFEKIIDALGGVSVDVPRDFLDTRYPGKNYSYETFEIKKGWRKLDGATALKYVRERHADPEGDFGRAKRQQQVMQAVRDKAFSTGTFLNIFTLSRLLDALGESIKTDITPDEMESFLSLLRTLDTKNITTVVIDAWKKESLLRVSHIPTPSGNAFVLLPRTGNWKEIQGLAHNIFSLEDIKQEREQVVSEQASLLIFSSPSQSDFARTLKQFLMDELGFTQVSIDESRLEDTPKQSTISERTAGQKLYSYNALLSRFNLEKVPISLPLNTRLDTNADFVLTIGEDMEESAFLGETGIAPEEINSEVLPPQELPQKKKKH